MKIIKRTELIFLVNFILTTLILVLATGCNSKNIIISKKANKTKNYKESALYNRAISELKKNNLKQAIKDFEQVSELYPFSYWGKRAEMMAAFVSYLKKDYSAARSFTSSYVKLYPSGEDIEYIYFLGGTASLASFKKISNDIASVFKAKQYFEALLEKFPNSKYSQKAKLKLLKINEIIEAKSLSIIIFYLQKLQYTAAISRLIELTKQPNFSNSKLYKEALYRLMEGYSALGLEEELRKTYNILEENYSDSQWKLYADKLMQESMQESKK